MPVTAAIAVGGSLIGGFFDRRSERSAERRNAKANATQLQTMRKDAEAAGVNMLTAMGSNANYGGGFFQPSTAMGDAVRGATNAFLGMQERKTIDRTNDAADKAIAANNNLRRSSPAQIPSGQPRIFDNSSTSDPAKRTQQDWGGALNRAGSYIKNMTAQHKPTFPVALPDGTVQRISLASAEFVGVDLGGLLTVSDMSSLWGHEVGEKWTSNRPWALQAMGMPRTQMTEVPKFDVGVSNVKEGFNIWGQIFDTLDPRPHPSIGKKHPLFR